MSAADLNRFYALLGMLEHGLGGAPKLRDCHGKMTWPKRGVYFFFEPSETRADGSTPRVVRVGTHAVSAGSKSTLWKRLQQHRGTQRGGGNHRGSIFRLHTGAALLNRSSDTLKLPTWGEKRNTNKAVRETEKEHEQRVSAYLGEMRVLWVTIEDEANKESDRAYIERHTIGLLSTVGKQLDSPSDDWLGNHSVRSEIRDSGLWNLQHLGYTYEQGFLERLEKYCLETLKHVTSQQYT